MKKFTARIADIALDLRSGFASGLDVPDGVIQFRMNNVDRAGRANWNKVRRVPREAVREELLALPGDILFNATNSPELVGKSALFQGHSEPVTFSNHFIRIRLKDTVADPGYVSRWLHREFERGRFAGMCRAWVNQASITKAQLSELTVPLPPLDEQRRIAAMLDKADALRQKRKHAIALLDSLTQSIFLELFGSVKPGDSKWSSVSVGEAGRVQLGRQRAPKYQTGHHTRPYVRVANVYEDRIDTSDILSMDFDDRDFKDYKLEVGDILLNEGQSTELVGRPAMWNNEVPNCCFQNTLVRFQVDHSVATPWYALGVFLSYFRLGEFAKISSKTSSVAHLGAARFARMPFPVPPLELQAEYGRRIEATRRQHGAAVQAMRLTDDFFASLQHRAFSGQL
ncbi:restriction endonuclease subunit S [Devosia sp.]|uniref:restriction endonuclease subunit S n=1 Tax=Devosia sp. TaxID=1871048 RepID=UPI003F7010DD